MEISITDNRNLKDIQEDFQKAYPFLKLEFYKNTAKRSGIPGRVLPLAGRTPIGLARHIHTEGTINASSSRSVEELENEFQSRFGLCVHIFRKSGRIWIETTLTHHWSLLRQNYEGQQMS